MPRAGLTGPRVIEEAARLADELGFEALTLAAVASRFGVAVPSLYKHVGGLDDVRRGVAVIALRELAVATRDAIDVATLGRAYRRYARQHPGRYAATVRAASPDPEHQAAAAEVLAIVERVLAGHGLTGDAAVDGARLLRATVHGYVALESAGGFALARDREASFEVILAALPAALDELATGVRDRSTQGTAS